MADDRTLDRNVVLTGFMGTGKTTVGRLVAELLELEFIDTDAVIEERHGPIPTIFAEHGEGTFRRFEREVAAELAARQGLAIATGGRTMVDAVNAQRLAATGDVVCLVASIDTVLERVDIGGAGSSRPMLTGTDGDVRCRIEGLLAERADAYGRFTAVDTDGREPTDIAAEVAALVRS